MASSHGLLEAADDSKAQYHSYHCYEEASALKHADGVAGVVSAWCRILVVVVR